MDGIINVYKEAGFTSHDVVAKLRGILKQKKIDFLSTDTHKKSSTYTKMEEIQRKLRKIVKEDYYNSLTFEIPNEILRNI